LISMMALSIRPAWAWAIIHGGKNVENRSTRTRFRGRFLVHASLALKQSDFERATQALRAAGEHSILPREDEFAAGGFIVIMGRKTYESIGKPLDGRDNIVITRRKDFAPPGVHVVDTVAGAVALGRELASRRGANEVAIIGGAEIFRAALPLAQRVYLTLVHGRPEGNIVLDAFDRNIWQEVSREPMQQATGDEFPAAFIVLDRQP
jgi:dihydrofolate reductase